MWRLHHYTLCAFSRKIRLVLAEYRLDFELKHEKPWERHEDFLALNPAGQVPILTRDDDERVLADSTAILEYLREEHGEVVELLGETPLARAEARRIAAWFDLKFQDEVTRYAFDEMIWKRFIEKAPANTKALRAARLNANMHLQYISYLADRRRWLAGDGFSIGDISAAAQVSIIDYLGLINWDSHPNARDWYMRVKSRPSMRALLADRLAGVKPAAHYDQLDF